MASELQQPTTTINDLDVYRIIQKGNEETLYPCGVRSSLPGNLTARELYLQGWEFAYTAPLSFAENSFFKESVESGKLTYFIDTAELKVFKRKFPVVETSLKTPPTTAPEKEYSPFREKLKKIPVQFEKDVVDFETYLRSTASLKFKITNKVTYKQSFKTEIYDTWAPYIHRWTSIYRKSILAKLYKLEDYCNKNPELLKNITMITLTVSQRGKDQEEALRDLMLNYKRLFDVLRHQFGSVDYFYILEPHKTGYAHMHVIYFKLFSEAEKRHVWSLWEGKYGAGVKDAFNFSEPRESEDGTCKKGEIKFIRSYVMKYISKSLRLEKMSKNVLLFNALLKKTKIRLWNCSRHLSKVMKQDKEVNEAIEDFECLSVELHDEELGNTEKDTFVRQVYPRPSYEEPIVLTKDEVHFREKKNKNHTLEIFHIQVEAVKEKLSKVVSFVKSKRRHVNNHEKQGKYYSIESIQNPKKSFLSDFDKQPADYGEVEGIEVLTGPGSGKKIAAWLRGEGY
jgi:hypothetical protein